MTLNVADLIILTVIAFSAILSIKRGFIREAFSLCTWVAAILIVRHFTATLAILLEGLITHHSIRTITAGVLLFIATLLIGSIIGKLLRQLVAFSGLSWTDRLLGVTFGIARGIVLVVIVIGVMQWSHFFDDAQWWQSSVSIPQLLLIAEWFNNQAVQKDLLAGIMPIL